MLVPVKQMTYLLYWSIILTMSSSIHLLNNTVTQDVAHYTDSMSTDLKELVSPNPSLPVKKKDRFLITGLTINIHQMTFKSFIIFLSGVVYMGDVFNNGNQIRSIRIVNSSSTGNYMNVSTYSNAFCILTDKLNYCNTNPKATAIFRICFFEDGIMQYNIVGSSSESESCNMTIEIANGIYNGSADGNGTIIKESVIHTVVYPGSIIVGDNTLTIAPLPRCLAQTFCNTCIAESLLNEKCTWSPNNHKCLPENSEQNNLSNISQCDYLEETQTKKSVKHELEDNDSTTDSQSFGGTLQHHDVDYEKSTTHSPPLETGFIHNYFFCRFCAGRCFNCIIHS